MGSGPIRLAADASFRAGIEAEGWTISYDEIEAVDETDPEIVRVIELIRRLADQVRQTVDEGEFPLVLAGNCNSALGTTAGIGTEDLGVVWFDAHADFDDPEENTSGFFDVMGPAMLTGRGWTALRQTIPGHVPIPERNVSWPPSEISRITSAGAWTRPTWQSFQARLTLTATRTPLANLRRRVPGVYLHVDLDSLDRDEAHANRYAAPGGPSLGRLLDCIRLAGECLNLVGAAITAYDPSFDPAQRTMSAAREIARGVRFHPASGTG